MSRIVALNIRHGGGKRQAALARWLLDTQADVFVLPEWRASSTLLAASMMEAGYWPHVAHRDDPKANGVAVIARSRLPSTRATPEHATKGELLQARFGQNSLVGAYFPLLGAKAPFFLRCAELSASANGSLLVIGDMNTGSNQLDLEPGASRFHCAREFVELGTRHGLHDLWRRQHGETAREWTWRSAHNGFRIDHAFANESWLKAHPSWRCSYDHVPRERGLSDHSAIIVDDGDPG